MLLKRYCKRQQEELRCPEICMNFEYDPAFPIRGLYYDKSKGCLMKRDFFDSIEPDGCYFGRRRLSRREIRDLYGTRHIGHDQARSLVVLMDFFCFSEVCGMEEPLEIPILNDLTMVLGSISQSKETAVVVDFTDPSSVYDNVKQATAFGMKSIVYVPRIKLDTVAALSTFCEKASMVSTRSSYNHEQFSVCANQETEKKDIRDLGPMEECERLSKDEVEKECDVCPLIPSLLVSAADGEKIMRSIGGPIAILGEEDGGAEIIDV